jgi:predicted tellurium resistance membrane protein TerC
MRPRLLPAISKTLHWGWQALGYRADTFRKLAMTQSQRLKYSILVVLVVLAIMLGLTWMQNNGMISEQLFQYIAIAVAVIVVVINGVMRRKVKP